MVSEDNIGEESARGPVHKDRVHHVHALTITPEDGHQFERLLIDCGLMEDRGSVILFLVGGDGVTAIRRKPHGEMTLYAWDETP